jgi:hypothetical protein
MKLDASAFLKLVSIFSGDDQPGTADNTPPFQGIGFEVMDIRGANLTRANLTRANLEDANLTRANLTRANLYGANLTRANLTRANLYGANLDGANLEDANLYGANLTRANLEDANLTRANLEDANLEDANLYGANLTRANLTRANLEDANLTRANLEYSKSVGTDVASIYLPGMSSRKDSLYARLVDGQVLFWAGCQRGVDAATLRERITQNGQKEEGEKALYRAAMDLLLLALKPAAKVVTEIAAADPLPSADEPDVCNNCNQKKTLVPDTPLCQDCYDELNDD